MLNYQEGTWLKRKQGQFAELKSWNADFPELCYIFRGASNAMVCQKCQKESETPNSSQIRQYSLELKKPPLLLPLFLSSSWFFVFLLGNVVNVVNPYIVLGTSHWTWHKHIAQHFWMSKKSTTTILLVSTVAALKRFLLHRSAALEA